MNTNGNVYTVIYSTIIVVVVAAVLAFAALSLKPMQDANVKAETLSQMMMAAGVVSSEDLASMSNNDILAKYSQTVVEAFTVNLDGKVVSSLNTAIEDIQLIDNLKPQNIGIKNGTDVTLPVYKFNNGLTVVAIYGAGLWGPIWGYIALEADLKTIAGVYFDHASETPGLGSKIKDEPSFAASFVGKSFEFGTSELFAIVKGGAPAGATNKVDAITGATMTCKGLTSALNVWIEAYAKYLNEN